MVEQSSGNAGDPSGGRIAALRAGQAGENLWLSDIQRTASSDEELFCLFVGPNAGRFIRTYHAMVEGTGRVWTFSWVVLLAALPWFFYRRMYLVGVGILVIPLVLGLLIPDYAAVGGLGIALVMAFEANRWYVQTAIARIEKIKALNLPEEERNDRIYQAGGVSPAGAAFGVIIVVALIALPFLAMRGTPLPDCGTEQVQSLTEQMLEDSLKKNGIRAMGLKLSNFETVESSPDGGSHICRFRAVFAGEDRSLFVGVSWSNPSTGQFRLQLGPTRDAVQP